MSTERLDVGGTTFQSALCKIVMLAMKRGVGDHRLKKTVVVQIASQLIWQVDHEDPWYVLLLRFRWTVYLLYLFRAAHNVAIKTHPVACEVSFPYA